MSLGVQGLRTAGSNSSRAETLTIGLVLIALPFLAISPTVISLPVLALLGGVLALKSPGIIFALYLYIPFYKSAVASYVPVDLTVVLAVVSAVLALPLWRSMWSRSSTAAVVLWVSMLAVVLLGGFYSPDAYLAQSRIIEFTALVFVPLFLAVRIISHPRFVNQFLITTALVSITISLVGAINLGSFGNYDRLEVASNTIGTGRSALLFVIILPGILRLVPHRLGLLSIAFCPIPLLVAISSGSRGPLVAGLVTMVLAQLLDRRLVGRRVLTMCVSGCFMLVLLQLRQIQSLLPGWSVSRFQTLSSAFFGEGDLDTSSLQRIQLFDMAFQMFTARPLIGFGTAGFEAMNSAILGVVRLTYPHNIILHVAADFGMLGLLVLITFIGTSLRQGLKSIHSPQGHALFSLTLFALLNAMVSNSFYDNRWLWGMLLMLAAMPREMNSLCYVAGANLSSVSEVPKTGALSSYSNESN